VQVYNLLLLQDHRDHPRNQADDVTVKEDITESFEGKEMRSEHQSDEKTCIAT
jgi:hypothetical protein